MYETALKPAVLRAATELLILSGRSLLPQLKKISFTFDLSLTRWV